MRRSNDLGGLAAGAVNTGSHEPAPWQKRLTALVATLGPRFRGVIRIDEFRRKREDLPPDLYHRLSYFELWAQGISDLLVEKGVLTTAEIDTRMAEIARRGPRA